MCPINPLRISYNWVSGEDHTSTEVKLKHSVKPMIIWATLWLTPRINPPLLPSSLSHTLSLVVHSSNIVGYLGAMHLKHTKVDVVSWMSSLRWKLNRRCLLLLYLLLIIWTIIIIYSSISALSFPVLNSEILSVLIIRRGAATITTLSILWSTSSS